MDRTAVDRVIHFEHMRRHVPGFVEALTQRLNPIKIGRIESERDIIQLLQQMFGEFPPEMFVPTLNTYRGVLEYLRYGQRAYVLGPELQELLTRTSLDNVPVEHVRVPLPGFYLALPGCAWECWGDSRTGWHRLVGAYASYYSNKELHGIDRCLQEWDPRCRLHPLPPDEEAHLGRIRIALCCAPNERSRTPLDVAQSFFSINLWEVQQQGGLEQHLQEQVKGFALYDERVPKEEFVRVEREIRERHREIFLKTLRLLVNLLLYLTTERRELRVVAPESRKSTPRNKKRLRRLARASQAVLYIVGDSLERARREARTLGGTHEGVVRHWVAGHWHTYLYGPRSGPQEPRLRWVMPYEKGQGPAPDRGVRQSVRVRE